MTSLLQGVRAMIEPIRPRRAPQGRVDRPGPRDLYDIALGGAGPAIALGRFEDRRNRRRAARAPGPGAWR